MIDGDFVAELRRSSQGPILLGADAFAPMDWQRFEPAAVDAPVPLGVAGLQGIADYLEANPDGLDLEKVFVLASEDAIWVYSKREGEDKRFRRAAHLIAKPPAPAKLEAGYREIGDAIVAILTLCDPTEESAKLLKLLSSVSDESVRTARDDGLTQEVTTRSGVALKHRTAVEPITMLAPFRTFREIEQVASPFLIRFQSSMSGLPKVGIFAADGEEWRVHARARVVSWLKEQVKVPIIG